MSDAPATPPLTLEWLPGTYAVCRLDPDQPIPSWAQSNNSTTGLLSITRTDHELSIVIDQSFVPEEADIRTERDFIALRIVGVLDFSLVGILARLSVALAAAKVSVFVISTFDTDLILMRSADRSRANNAI